MKYNVGDRVRIKNFDWFRNEGANMVVTYMTKYYGEVVTIKSVHKGFYRIKEDGGQYCWIDEMFECKMEEETKPELKFKVGDKVRIKSIDWYNMNKNKFEKVWCANGHIPFDKDMCKYCGKVMTISHVRADHYTMVEDLVHYWTDDMIECKVEEGAKSHNNMCKQLIDEMNPNVEVNVKTKPEPKFKVGDIITKAHLRFRIIAVDGDKYVVENTPGIYMTLLFNDQDDYNLREEGNKPIDLTVKGEEAKERIEIAIPEGYEYVIESDKIIFTKKKKEYPKTFEECVSVLMCEGGNRMSLEQMNTFRKLIDARNAYWTIYGIENGLGKPWEPTMETVYCISRNENVMKCSYRGGKSNVLEFPTEEMRDTFYENFKSEIESCKEFL